MDTFYYILGGILLLALVIAAFRFFQGPTAPDRIVALDAMSIILTAGLAMLALVFHRFIYIDVALIYAILGFMGIVSIARWMEKGI